MSMTLSGLEIRPHRTEVEHDDPSEGIILQAAFRLPPEESDRLRELADRHDYFTVKEEGEPEREMRFGQVLWSQAEGETKFLATLVEKRVDEAGRGRSRGLDEPESTNARNMLAQTAAAFDSLLEILESRGVLNEADVAWLRDVDSRAIEPRLWDFFRVKDADDWWIS